MHMGSSAARRVALMALHPRYAEAILSGRKRAEFRKRPLAADVDVVLIYATAPVSAIVGWFKVRDTVKTTLKDMWCLLHAEGDICWSDFWDYFAGYDEGVALLVGEVGRLVRPVALSEIRPVPATPQSFSYISDKVWAQVIASVEAEEQTALFAR